MYFKQKKYYVFVHCAHNLYNTRHSRAKMALM